MSKKYSCFSEIRVGEKFLIHTEEDFAEYSKVDSGNARSIEHGVVTGFCPAFVVVAKPKGLRLNVYRASLPVETMPGLFAARDCTNGGISSDHDSLTLIGPDVINGGEIAGVFEPDDEAPAVCLSYVDIGDERHYHLRPADPYTGEPLPGWYMNGGNIASTSDSRFPNDYPLNIHDRRES